MANPVNIRTHAEYFIKGLTGGFVDPKEVIAWADELLVTEADTEEWVIDVSTSAEDDRMGVLHHLHSVKGDIYEAALAALLDGKLQVIATQRVIVRHNCL